MERRLAAILAIDVVGYTRLMGADEEATLANLHQSRGLIDALVTAHDGRTFGVAGDSAIAEFASPVKAVQCAIKIQQDMAELNSSLPSDKQMQLRIGVNLGDAIVDEDALFGEGVNIAARLEQLAAPGGIVLSRAVRDQIRDRLALNLADLGEIKVKNVARPVHSFQVLRDGETPMHVPKSARRFWRTLAYAALVIIILSVAGIIWQMQRPDSTPADPTRMAFQLPDKPSIAVLPFTNMSGDPGQEYFADGMTEDLITDLSKVSGLFVIARNSTFTYKGKTAAPQQVAEELGVRYVLEGSVRRADGKVRINAQLIDATTGGHVWAERYDSSLTDVFALQDKVTENIVTALAVNLTVAERERQAREETNIPEAYDAFLRGWAHYVRHTPEDFAKAIPYLDNAVKLDPTYGRAHAALAAIYWEGFSHDWAKNFRISNNEAYETARRHLEKALSRPTPLAHRIAADTHLTGSRWDEAIAEAERAIELDPNDPEGYAAMSSVLVRVGRPADSLEFIKTAKRLDPQSDYLSQLGGAQFHLERYEEAAATLLRATKRNRNDEWIFLLLAAAYGQLGREQEAKSAIETFHDMRLKAQKRPYTLSDIDDWNFKETIDRERLRNGLRKAGLPEGTGLPQHKSLTSAILRSLFPGNTATGETIFGGGGHVYHKPNGTLIIRTFDGQTDRGTWEITGDGQFCHQWNNFGVGKKTCFLYFAMGGEYEYWQADGSRMLGKFKLRLGNPENL